MNIINAINSLRPNSNWYLDGDSYDGLCWSNENELPPPTEDEVNEEIERLKEEYKNLQYQRDRASEYPSIEDQLDILYHGGYNAWKKEISKIKEKYPKP